MKFLFTNNLFQVLVGCAVNFPKRIKIAVLILADFICLNFGIILTLLMFDSSRNLSVHILNQSIIYSIIFITVSYLFGLYSISTRYFGIYAVKKILLLFLICTTVALLFKHSNLYQIEYNEIIFAALITLFITVGVRVLIREIFFSNRQVNAPKCLVYGAGAVGIEFLTATMQGNSYSVVGFIDDDVNKVGRNYQGREVFRRNRLAEIIDTHKVEIIVLAIPSVGKSKRRGIIEFVLKHPVRLVSVPKIGDLVNKNYEITQTQNIEVTDLIGREIVAPNLSIIESFIENNVILVTGAGGSIGSEITRQLISFKPKSIILFDNNEPSLFRIDQEISKVNNCTVIPVLGSVLDQEVLTKTFSEHSINIVFHAAAYKHVPLVESNAYVAFNNNVLGTKNLLEYSIKYNCKSFTLVSTDKAVRPTNLMGASKRLAELLCQINSAECSTIISMVRFGNVIGSSGSVIPTFLEQIHKGGPLTVTHPDVVRFFMTIPEAAQLVLQSSSISTGGEVFLLDMGEPVKIFDLAKRLIKLSGNMLSESEDDDGISIVFTGLRPGEKLFEELLVDSDAESTEHPRIFKAKEKSLPRHDLEVLLRKAQDLLSRSDIGAYTNLLRNSIVRYNNQESVCSEDFDLNISCEDISQKENPEVSDVGLENKRQDLFFGSRFLSFILHIYFRLVRGLTIGVRCIIVKNAREVLLIKHSYTTGWHLPGGGVEVNESVEDALKREIFEECGILIKGNTRLLNINHNSKVSNRDHVFTYIADNWKTEISEKIDQNEVIEKKLFDLNSLPDDIEFSALNSLNLYKSLIR